ncbi:hypothetical protein ECL_04513 [Enterobacter cloacae subsp. cloacae ATCC 13047]|uniref:Uncharacterized protein n=1 Tax=Enterobacter cloacae subsp. cloacae (strain ATCC 13047 / DSM 30054 / NBRC 13535 / NCTC 10005 / WDCM 00083 / NCDC 279-56) TaxID=716541 RepID=A0A0H3CS77_ENTCC|nr:hypothetical protein ECL_04513 [Enterobacter cloacae subsp. cloacae ATCC 13047]
MNVNWMIQNVFLFDMYILKLKTFTLRMCDVFHSFPNLCQITPVNFKKLKECFT